MNRIDRLRLSIFLSVIILTNACSAQSDSIYGVWRIAKCISDDYNEPTISKEEQIREVGRRLIITPEKIVVSFKNFSDTCLNPSFKISNIYTRDYFKEDKQMITWLGFTPKRKVEVIKSNCESFWFKQFYRPEKKLLIMRAEGFFYYLKQEISFSATNIESGNAQKEITFIRNQTVFENEKATIDSLKNIANLLKKDASLVAIISGNTNNKLIADLNSSTTINGKNGTFKDLLLARADAVAKVLVNKLGVNPNQIITRVGQLGGKRSTMVVLIKQ